MRYLAIMNTTNAIIMKFSSSPKNAPNLKNIGPICSMNSFQAPPGIKNPTIGIIRLSTNDFTRLVAAAPMMNAIAKAITLYSLKNSMNSFTVFFDFEIN